MASKRTTLPKDFDDLLEAGDLAAMQAVFDRCRLDARGGYDKGTALSFVRCPDELARWLVEQGLDALTTCQNADIALVAESAALLLAAGAAVPENAERLVTRIGTSFEENRSRFNTDFLDETDAGLQRLYGLFDVAPVARG